jgi:hypothetical protein
MNERKKIESLFQEKFKNFEVAPPEMAWTNIKNELEKKKQKRRIIPFWWKLSGVAALLLVCFFIGTNFNSNTKPLNKNAVAVEENSTSNNSSEEETSTKNNALTNQSRSEEVLSNKEVLVNSVLEKKENPTTSVTNSSKNAVVLTKNNSSQKNNLVSNFNKNSSNTVLNSKNETDVLNSKKENNFIKNETKTTNLISDIVLKTDEKINSNFNTSEAKIAETKIDSSQIATISENKLEEILKEKETNKTAKKEKKSQKWQISTHVSPIYASSNATGSAIDEKYVDNKKTYENTISYGLGVNYALNKKIKIRTGINKFSLGYNTNDVGFYSTKTVAQTLDNVQIYPVVPGQITTFVDNNTTVIPPAEGNSLAGLEEIKSVEKGTINQKLGYYEVPLELSYALINKRFGINLIGGISTLFLDENKISTITKTTKINTGKADNLNNIHFSTNIGIGFKYNLIKSIQINVDPMLKYQINTFSNDVGGFKPYFFGFYLGINYQF